MESYVNRYDHTTPGSARWNLASFPDSRKRPVTGLTTQGYTKRVRREGHETSAAEASFEFPPQRSERSARKRRRRDWPGYGTVAVVASHPSFSMGASKNDASAYGSVNNILRSVTLERLARQRGGG